MPTMYGVLRAHETDQPCLISQSEMMQPEMPPPPAAGADAPPPFVDPRIKWPTFEDDAGVDVDDAGTPPAPPPRPTCTGKPGSPGNTTRMYQDREYIVHIPPDVDPNQGLPIMFVYHGAGGKGAIARAKTRDRNVG